MYIFYDFIIFTNQLGKFPTGRAWLLKKTHLNWKLNSNPWNQKYFYQEAEKITIRLTKHIIAVGAYARE